MTRVLKICVTATLVVAMLSPARAADVVVGAAIADMLRDIVAPVVSAAVMALVGWVAMVLKNKFNVDIEAQYRDALTAFLQRQASSLIADGAVRLEGVKINVQNDALAAAANAAFTAIPQVMKFFNLTPDRIASMIVDMLPKQPAVAQAAAVAIDTANPSTASKAS